MSTSWSKGSSTRWRKLRAAVLAENVRTNGGACTLALPGTCTGVATQVHHTLGRAVTGDDPKHLVAACAACNQSIGDPTKHNPSPRPTSRW